MSLKSAFKRHCLEKKLHINESQIHTIDLLDNFFNQNKSNLLNLFGLLKSNLMKTAFYLRGDVGVGKTMILDFFFKHTDILKQRFHFNEFMINFHNFRHEREKSENNNYIEVFVKKLKKKYKLIYLDEFQVTNIVDAMILGKLFEMIIKENILIVITSNTKIEDLYKDGLQRDQFLPFISLIKNFSIEHELIIDEDYRKAGLTKLERFFSPLNEKTNFKINQLFRELTKNKKPTSHKILVKGREFLIKSFYEGVAKFNFNELCDQNIGGEDYIQIAKNCNFITIEDVPNFTDENINMQQRFITLIDILYEKKIPLLISSNFNLSELNGSKRLEEPFKRTISRIYELTSPNIKIV
jgi:cell division protein ZapE